MFYIFFGDDFFQIDLEDFLFFFYCWLVDIDVFVKMIGMYEGFVEYVGMIGVSKNNNLFMGVEVIYFG